MRRAEISSRSTSELVEAYASAAAFHGRATEVSDPRETRSANRAADLIAAIYREFRARGNEACEHLLPLLSHPEPGVRGWAGAHALEFAPKLGEPVLEELARLPRSPVGFSAEITIREWKAGRLRFP
jgi:hypothetical protein